MRFTIRDLLWLMVVVGLGLGWAVDHTMLVGLVRTFSDAYGDCLRRQHPGEPLTPRLPDSVANRAYRAAENLAGSFLHLNEAP